MDFQKEWLRRIETIARMDETPTVVVEPDTFRVVRRTLPASDTVTVFSNLSEDEAKRLVNTVLKPKILNKRAVYYDLTKETL